MRVFYYIVLFILLPASLIHANSPPPPSYTLKTTQGPISYYRIGEGKPVVLLHGLFANKEQWLNLVQQLQAHRQAYQFIIPDLPGFGQSVPFPTTIYNLTAHDNPSLNQVMVLHEFLTQLKLSSPIALAGNSLGGLIAERYAETYPHEVSSLTFMGSPAGVTPFTEAFYQQLAQGYNPFIPLSAAQIMEELKLLMVNIKPNVPSSTQMEQLIQFNQKQYPHLALIYMMTSTYHHMQALFQPLPKIQMPVLIFWGLQDRLFGDVKYAYFLQSRFTQSPLKQVIPLEHAGHVVMLENNEVLRQIALKYLDFLKTAHQQMNVEFA